MKAIMNLKTKNSFYNANHHNLKKKNLISQQIKFIRSTVGFQNTASCNIKVEKKRPIV
jgi:hypothetical protein